MTYNIYIIVFCLNYRVLRFSLLRLAPWIFSLTLSHTPSCHHTLNLILWETLVDCCVWQMTRSHQLFYRIQTSQKQMMWSCFAANSLLFFNTINTSFSIWSSIPCLGGWGVKQNICVNFIVLCFVCLSSSLYLTHFIPLLIASSPFSLCFISSSQASSVGWQTQ